MRSNQVCFQNLTVLANATEIATELALDVLKNSTELKRDTNVPVATRNEIQNGFVSHIGSRLAPKGE